MIIIVESLSPHLWIFIKGIVILYPLICRLHPFILLVHIGINNTEKSCISHTSVRAGFSGLTCTGFIHKTPVITCPLQIIGFASVLSTLDELNSPVPCRGICRQVRVSQGLQCPLKIREVRPLICAITNPAVKLVLFGITLPFITLHLNQIFLCLFNQVFIFRISGLFKCHH